MIALLAGLWRLARPRHWVKNAFVLLPMPFAIAAGSPFDPWKILGGFAAFSCLASAVYAFNDTWDAERDRQHPTKCRRPVASGEVSPAAALIFGTTLLVLGLALSYIVGGTSDQVRVRILGLAFGYLSIQVVYTTFGRALAGIDVLLLASGFVVRVLYGCALVAAPPSPWLLVCTTAIALFLALTKRRADLASGVDEVHRPSLAGYSTPVIDTALVVIAIIASIAYGFYCSASPVFHPGREYASLPFVIFGFLNDLRLIRTSPELAPVERLFGHGSHIVNLLLWGGSIWGSLA